MSNWVGLVLCVGLIIVVSILRSLVESVAEHRRESQRDMKQLLVQLDVLVERMPMTDHELYARREALRR